MHLRLPPEVCFLAVLTCSSRVYHVQMICEKRPVQSLRVYAW
jgi:hypothetical protein